MITPRITRLIRVPDLHDFRRVIAALCAAPPAADASSAAAGALMLVERGRTEVQLALRPPQIAR